jgi:hypothetical protein
METFEIAIGQSHRQLRIEPQPATGAYNIYAVDRAEDWIDHEQARSVDVPADGLLGTITVKSERDFNFEGAGAFSGQDLLSIATQITLHPSYQQQ